MSTSTDNRTDWSRLVPWIFSTLIWLGGIAYFSGTLVGAVDNLRVEISTHASRLTRLEREGSDIAKQDHQRVVILEKRADASDVTFAQIREILTQLREQNGRIDENVRALKEASKHQRP